MILGVAPKFCERGVALKKVRKPPRAWLLPHNKLNDVVTDVRQMDLLVNRSID